MIDLANCNAGCKDKRPMTTSSSTTTPGPREEAAEAECPDCENMRLMRVRQSVKRKDRLGECHGTLAGHSARNKGEATGKNGIDNRMIALSSRVPYCLGFRAEPDFDSGKELLMVSNTATERCLTRRGADRGKEGMKMKYKATLSPPIAAAVLVGALGSYFARAQTTPGAIPNPGTYQGSTQLQQEQDRQAQQYRQQSAQPFQPQPQQPQGSYPGRSPTTSNAPRPPDCLDRIARQPELAPLVQKVHLGRTDLHSSALFGIQAVPTASERPLLLKWSASRRICWLEQKKRKSVAGSSAQAKRADDLSQQITIDMIAQLAEGKLTYGQFNRQRTMNAIVVDKTP